MFSKFDKITKSDIFLYNPKFNMPNTNSKRTFDKFFTRFIFIITLLDFIDYYKISNF